MKNNLIGFGTAAIGRPQYINIRQEGKSEVSLVEFKKQGLRMLDLAYQEGIRYFDTAPGYGMAEQLLIEWLAEKKDPSIEVATKWGYTYVANFDPNAIKHEIKEHSIDKLNEQWQQSQRLFPYLKVYQIHSATLESGVLSNKTVLHRLAELKTEHGILIGMTSTGRNQVDVISKAMDIEVDGIPLFDLFQGTYNIFDQSLVDISDRFDQSNRRLVIKEAMANGRVFPNNKYTHYTSTYKTLHTLANKYNVGIDAIALRFCIDSMPVYQVLSGAANAQHLISNLEANSLALESSDLDLLRSCAIDPSEYWSERKQLGWQ